MKRILKNPAKFSKRTLKERNLAVSSRANFANRIIQSSLKIIRWFERHYKVSWMITVLGALAIFYISTITFPPSPKIIGLNLKAVLYHILAFFFFSFFLLISLIKGKYKHLVVLGILIAIIYAMTDEIHQFFVPGRNLSLFDVWLDSIGILLASTIYLSSLRRKFKNI